jgi:hypothetical protein
VPPLAAIVIDTSKASLEFPVSLLEEGEMGILPSYGEVVKGLSWLLEKIKEGITISQQKAMTTAREDPNLYKFLEYLYGAQLGDHILIDGDFTFPTAIFPAGQQQRYNLESILGTLDLDSEEKIDSEFETYGKPHIRALERDLGHFWNGDTYRMQRFTYDGHLRLDCALGKYYEAVKSQDIFGVELLLQFHRHRPHPEHFETFRDLLALRRRAHDLRDPFCKPSGVSAAISVDTMVLFADKETFKVLLWQRSIDVAVYPNNLQVIPAGMFAPVTGNFKEEYSVKHNVYREFLEEALSLKEVLRAEGFLAHDYFYDDPNLQYLQKLEDEGSAQFYLTGVSVDLLNLRPGICVLLLIKDPDWIVNQSHGKKVRKWQLKKISFNYEFKNKDELTRNKCGPLDVDMTKDIVFPQYCKPKLVCPSTAAALRLGVATAREELGLA